ncbi:hypothetical protein LJR074_001967 [Acidovorax sp. LjRoot74]|uniref:hypothetical protein n=1 Tax=Acidovorax sp. LjRoot74 TaxID=3342337 RepID=UPI003ECE9A8F
MATWADFYPELMPHVVGCPQPMANIALREAARVFFERTRIWREWLDLVSVQANVREYDLDVPDGAMVVRIERTTLDGEPLAVLSFNQLPSDPAQSETSPGLTSRDRAVFTLTRALPAGKQISVFASLKPTKTAMGVPDDLFEHHGQDIVEGAKRRLMMVRGTSFYAPDLAAMAGTEFESAIGTKTVTAWRSATGNTPRARVGWA